MRVNRKGIVFTMPISCKFIGETKTEITPFTSKETDTK